MGRPSGPAQRLQSTSARRVRASQSTISVGAASIYGRPKEWRATSAACDCRQDPSKRPLRKVELLKSSESLLLRSTEALETPPALRST